jgi:hypothetical protein
VVRIGRIPYRIPLPMKSLHIYRESALYPLNVVRTESVLVVDALTFILALALSTSRAACHLLCRHSLRIASILVGLATYPRRRSIALIIPLDFHSERQSLCRSACGMCGPDVIIDRSDKSCIMAL